MRYALFFLFSSLALAQPPLPWYMRETAMTPEGKLTFLDKPWWGRAQALGEGESFTLDLNQDGRPDTMIQRKDGAIVEAIDDSGRNGEIWGGADTAYVVSLKGDGLADRLVDYIDNNGDGKFDEMEFRHYRDGFLRYAWFGVNYDNDGEQIFELRNWSYAGNNGKNKFRGNLEIFLNKFEPQRNRWSPLSECPFTFWDENKDGHGEMVLRVSAAPLASAAGKDLDYANNYDYMWAAEVTPAEQVGNMNVRFSVNLDAEPRKDPVSQPHYTFGFTMTGAQPYNYPNRFYTNPRRRPPQTVSRIRREDGVNVAMNYPAEATGFTWDEARSVFRWEGQFWIYERRLLRNTGGPTHRWNMRREYLPKPSTQRQVYFSEVDQRYHLLGASEGWMEVGHLVNQQKDLEFRYFDKDGDGMFDTWQVFSQDSPSPVRVSRFGTPRARKVLLNRVALRDEYNQRTLPKAIAESQQLISALKRVGSSPLAEAYEAEAAKTESVERRRYCLDIARELYFLKARDTLLERNAKAWPYPQLPDASGRTLQMGPIKGRFTLGDSLAYWKVETAIEALMEAYGEGRLSDARTILEGMEK